MRAAIWSSEKPLATQNGLVIGSIAEMSSLNSRAKRTTARMPGRRSSARIGSPSVSGCAVSRRGEGGASVATASAPSSAAPARKRGVPAVTRGDPDQERAADEARAPVRRDPHRVGHAQLAAVRGLDGVGVDRDVLGGGERDVAAAEARRAARAWRAGIGAGEHRGRERRAGPGRPGSRAAGFPAGPPAAPRGTCSTQGREAPEARPMPARLIPDAASQTGTVSLKKK